MPLDDRWDKLNDAEWASFADAWLAELRDGNDSKDDNGGMSVTWMGFTARPEQQWKFIRLATSRVRRTILTDRNNRLVSRVIRPD